LAEQVRQLLIVFTQVPHLASHATHAPFYSKKPVEQLQVGVVLLLAEQVTQLLEEVLQVAHYAKHCKQVDVPASSK
jgi:hypothetical protein